MPLERLLKQDASVANPEFVTYLHEAEEQPFRRKRRSFDSLRSLRMTAFMK